MADYHNYSFFGQKVGLIVQSSSKNEPLYFLELLKVKKMVLGKNLAMEKEK
ncbi:hypothetical protein LCGC14_2644520 [marine sediment metagenome]|uniref:Uncharacterized protein n=1 Tax=marine sediment metagenome TaxID=412755 RepID=A0A0F9C728_9ZZZZ